MRHAPCVSIARQDFGSQLGKLTRAVQQERDEALICVRSDAIGAVPQVANVSATERVMLGVVKHGVVLWAANICHLQASELIGNLVLQSRACTQQKCCPAPAVHREFCQR